MKSRFSFDFSGKLGRADDCSGVDCQQFVYSVLVYIILELMA